MPQPGEQDFESSILMKRGKAERKIIEDALTEWQVSGTLPADEASRLKATIEPDSGQRAQLSQYFFIIAVSSALLACGALFLDDKILEKLRLNFLLSNYTIATGALLLAAGAFYLAHRKHSQAKGTALHEANLIPGTLFTIIALVYACKEWGGGEGYSVFLGLSTIVFSVVSILFGSRSIWVVAIVSGCAWFGALSTVYSHQGLFLGLNYPARFACFGLLILAGSLAQKRIARLMLFSQLSWQAGLLVLYTALWGLSIFGNYADLDQWRAVRQAQVLVYGVVFGVAAGAGLYLGIRRDDDALRDYSILFLLLNLYTRYFEYFWNGRNKGLFFLVLAVSFWLVGRWLARSRAEVKR